MRIRACLGMASVLACALTACRGQPTALVGDMTCPEDDSNCEGVPPSFSAAVLPIIRSNCIGCHIGGGVAADRPLTTYAQVVKLERSTFNAVYSCVMPPAYDTVDQLTMAQRNTLLQWLACGAPDN